MLKFLATILFQNSFIALLLFFLIIAVVLKKCFRKTIHMDTKKKISTMVVLKLHRGFYIVFKGALLLISERLV